MLYHRLFSLCVNIAAFNTFLQTLIVKHFKLLKELYNCYYYLISFLHGCGRTNQNSGQITLKGTQTEKRKGGEKKTTIKLELPTASTKVTKRNKVCSKYQALRSIGMLPNATMVIASCVL